MRPSRVSMLALASAGYVVVGTGTALLARTASSPAAVKGWRLAAWLLSLAIFLLHFTVERRRRMRTVHVALSVGLAVALGAAGVAALGPLRAHWSEPARFRLALLSIVAWPILAGVPAFLVALIGGAVLDRASGTSDSGTPR